MLWNPYVTQIVSPGYLWSNHKKHARRRWFYTKNPKEKTDFICQLTGPAGKFWQMESTLSTIEEISLCSFCSSYLCSTASVPGFTLWIPSSSAMLPSSAAITRGEYRQLVSPLDSVIRCWRRSLAVMSCFIGRKKKIDSRFVLFQVFQIPWLSMSERMNEWIQLMNNFIYPGWHITVKNW